MTDYPADHFFYREKNRHDETYHRLWIGPLLDPSNTLGIITGTGTREGYDCTDCALPLSSVPQLIAFLQSLDLEETTP